MANEFYTMCALFNDQCERLRKYITPSMFQGTADSSVELAPTIQLIRG